MRFIRRHRRAAAYPALLALLLQIVLAFGHIHPANAGRADELGAPPTKPRGTAALTGPYGAAAADDRDALPGRHGDGDYCAIYAMNALLSGVQAALPPELPASSANMVPSIVLVAEQIRTASSPKAFHSRAPPLP